MIFGIIWVGFLFFFVVVQQRAAAEMGAARRSAMLALAPRAMYWFRWAALWTFLTGVLLLGMVYHMAGLLYGDEDGNGIVTLLVFLTALLIAGAFDQVAARFSSNVTTIVGLVLLMVLIVLMNRVAGFGARSLFIHVGGVMGLVLVMNVWMRVWPAWRRSIIPALEAGEDPDPAVMTAVNLRATQSLFIAVPTVLLMISNHYPTIYGSEHPEASLMGVIVFGFVIAWLFVRKKGPGTGVEVE